MRKKMICAAWIMAAMMMAASCGNAAGTSGPAESTAAGSISAAAGDSSAGNDAAAGTDSAIIDSSSDAAGIAAALEDLSSTYPVLADESREATGEFSIISSDRSAAVTEDGSVYTITGAGIYTVSGKLSEGQIVVNVSESEEVKLVLNGVTITSSTSAPICIISADKVEIEAAKGTYNAVCDNRATAGASADYDAAIWSACDLKLTGSGTLVVSASLEGGIKSKDDLKLKNISVEVTAAGNALKGNDSVTAEDSLLVLFSSAGSGIKTSNSKISSKGNQKGTVTILGGQTYITSGGDCVSSAYNVEIGNSAAVSLISAAANTADSAAASVSAPGSSAASVSTSGGPAASTPGSSSADSGTSAAKGIKAGNEILIASGVISVIVADDGIHASADNLENGSTGTGNVSIRSGSVAVSCGDDGIHADGAFAIDSGSLVIVKSHEGIEANTVTVNGGSVLVNGEDDGINAFKGAQTPTITINGGYVEVTSPAGDTDAMDSNGNIQVAGGIVVVKSGSSAGMMAGSVDVDGEITVTGGTIIAFGGICETPSAGSVNTFIADGNTFGAGDYVLSAKDGGEVISFTLDADYTSCWVASDKLESGKEYVMTRAGEEVLSWTQTAGTVGEVANRRGMSPG